MAICSEKFISRSVIQFLGKPFLTRLIDVHFTHLTETCKCMFSGERSVTTARISFVDELVGRHRKK